MKIFIIKFITTIYIFFDAFVYFLKNEYSLKLKIIMLGTYIKLFLLFIISPFYKNKFVKIHAFNIAYPDIYILVNLYSEIFLRGDYYFTSNKHNPNIIDSGANIGISILYFKFLYPGCKIIAFEPNLTSNLFLKQNIINNNLKDISVINKALSYKNNTLLYFGTNSPADVWASVVNDKNSECVKNREVSYVRSTILSKYINKSFDMLKIDIEGSEYDVFRDLKKHNSLRFVKNIAMEIHHNFDNLSSLASLLSLLEKSKMVYQIDSRCIPIAPAGKPQTMILYATKRL